MNNLLKFFPIFLAFISLTVIYSCEKDIDSSSNAVESRTKINGDGDGRDWSTDYDCTNRMHGDVAKGLSSFFESRNVRKAFDNFRKTKQNSVVLLADFMYNGVLNNQILTTELSTSLTVYSGIPLCDFFNIYLKSNPGIEVSFVQDIEDEYGDIINITKFETVTVYRNCDKYPVYVNGKETTSFYTESDTPSDKIILKLQASDVYETYKMDALSSSNIISQINTNTKFSDLLRCNHVTTYINGVPNVTSSIKTIQGCVVTNPLSNVKIVLVDNIYQEWNKRKCGVSDDLLDDTDQVTEFRMGCDRDNLRNGYETILDIRGKDKHQWRACDTWCSYWNKVCNIQIDVAIPTKKTDGFSSFGSVMQVVSLNEKRLRNGWFNKEEVQMFKWKFLEGQHGDEVQYKFTGRHRKRGTVTKKKWSLSISSTIGFVVDAVRVTLNPKIGYDVETTHANEDCPLGTPISYYCDDLPERLIFGDSKFQIVEK